VKCELHNSAREAGACTTRPEDTKCQDNLTRHLMNSGIWALLLLPTCGEILVSHRQDSNLFQLCELIDLFSFIKGALPPDSDPSIHSISRTTDFAVPNEWRLAGRIPKLEWPNAGKDL
jgi:hypothetical protein